VCEKPEFSGRRGTVSVYEADEITVATPEGLHDHPALTELGVFDQVHAIVMRTMASNDVGRSICAGVERDEQPHVEVREGGPVRVQRPIDPVLFIVSRNDEI
jgi:hypothetical protein